MTLDTAFITIATAGCKTYVYRMKQNTEWDAGAGIFFIPLHRFHHRKEVNLEKEEEQVQEQPKKSKMEELDEEAKKQGKKVNKTWEAFGKSKGCFIINDPRFLL